MIRKFLAGLVATCAVLVGLTFTGVTPAMANATHSITRVCPGVAGTTLFTAEYYHYLDGGNNWRARLVKTTFSYQYSTPLSVVFASSFFSDSGQAWSDSVVLFSSGGTLYAPSQANGRLIYNPKAFVHVKYNGNDCGGDIKLYG